ncbi:MAG: glycosyltransferase, partial [Planctomycetota bacterium]
MRQPITSDSLHPPGTWDEVVHLIPSLDWGDHAFHMRTVIHALAPHVTSTVHTMFEPLRANDGEIPVFHQQVRSPFDLPSLWKLAKRLEATSSLVITWGRANRVMLGFWRLGIRPVRWLATAVGDLLLPQVPEVGQLQLGYDGDEGTHNGALRSPQAKLGYRVHPADEGATTTRGTIRHQLGLPLDSKLVGMAGSLGPEDHLKDAIWAADLLKVVRDDVHLLLIGNGPDRWRWEKFRRAVQIEDRVHFL